MFPRPSLSIVDGLVLSLSVASSLIINYKNKLSSPGSKNVSLLAVISAVAWTASIAALACSNSPLMMQTSLLIPLTVAASLSTVIICFLMSPEIITNSVNSAFMICTCCGDSPVLLSDAYGSSR